MWIHKGLINSGVECLIHSVKCSTLVSHKESGKQPGEKQRKVSHFYDLSIRINKRYMLTSQFYI